MHKKVIFLFLSFIIPNCLLANEADFRKIANTWLILDISTAAMVEKGYDILENKPSETTLLITTLEKQLSKDYNPVLETRLLLLKARYLMLKKQFTNECDSIFKKALQKAAILNSDQLKVEVYYHYGEFFNRKHSTPDFLLNTAAALSFQEKLGTKYYPAIHLSYFAMSRALYDLYEYKQSIIYARKCLLALNTDTTLRNRITRLYVMDLLAGNFKELKQYDSSLFYYKKVVGLMDSAVLNKVVSGELWKASVSAGIVDNNLSLKNGSPAFPSLYNYLEASNNNFAYPNIVSAAYFLGNAHTSINKTDSAIYYYKVAYRNAESFQNYHILSRSAANIAEAYKKLQSTDSAFAYFDLFTIAQGKIAAFTNENGIEAVNAKIRFDTLNSSLTSIEKEVAKEKLIRNISLSFITVVLLFSLALLFVHRRRQKEKLQLSETRRSLAEKEILLGRTQLEYLSSLIAEKNKMVDELSQKIKESESNAAGNTALLENLGMQTQEDWLYFKKEFSKVYPNFLPALNNAYKETSPAEERLSILIFLEFDDYQMATTLGISKESVSRAKRRLKAHFTISEEVNLTDFLTGMDKRNIQ